MLLSAGSPALHLNGYVWVWWQVSKVGDKDLYVKAGTYLPVRHFLEVLIGSWQPIKQALWGLSSQKWGFAFMSASPRIEQKCFHESHVQSATGNYVHFQSQKSAAFVTQIWSKLQYILELKQNKEYFCQWSPNCLVTIQDRSESTGNAFLINFQSIFWGFLRLLGSHFNQNPGRRWPNVVALSLTTSDRH